MTSSNPEKTNQNGNTHANFLYNFLTAGISSSISVTVMAPVERVKLILQVQNCGPEPVVENPYKNFPDAITRLVKEQGFFSLWRGNLASVIRCFPYQALNFSLKDKYQSMLVDVFPAENIYGRLGASLLAGGIGGATAICIVYPLDFARTRMALNMEREINIKGNPEPEKKITLKRTLSKSYKAEGIRGLYRGLCFSMLGIFVYRAIYFGLYDAEKFFTPVEHRGFLVSFLQAEVAAIASGWTSYPIDTVRRTIMMQNKSTGLQSPKFHAQRIYARQGIRGFYRGATVNVLRGTGGAIMLILNDYWQALFLGMRREEASPSEAKNALPVSCSFKIPPFGGSPVLNLCPLHENSREKDQDKNKNKAKDKDQGR